MIDCMALLSSDNLTHFTSELSISSMSSSSSNDLLLFEKCKIALWMEQFQNALKVQSKFQSEFFKPSPSVSLIIEIHQKFLTTGSVLDFHIAKPNGQNNNVARPFNNIKKYDEKPQKEKWRDRPKIKITDGLSSSSSVKKEDVSIAREDLNEEEIKECMIEISLNETNSGDLIEGEENPEKYTCIHCGQRSMDKVSHCRHLKIHCSDFFNCPNCEFTCNNTSLLRSHRLSCKPLNSNFNWTGKSESMNLSSEDINDRFEQSAFSGQELFKCKLCNSIFPSGNVLDEHLNKNCSLKPYDFESSKSEKKSNGTILISELQLKRPSLKNETINGASEFISELTTHQKILAKKGKIFSCDQCSFTTHKKVYLKNHKTIHSDGQETPHECSLCGQKFRSKRSLSYHTDNSHIDKEVLECPFCDFRQKNKMLLQIHMRRHTGEKPYKCEKPHCNFKGRISQELRRHMQMDHSFN